MLNVECRKTYGRRLGCLHLRDKILFNYNHLAFSLLLWKKKKKKETKNVELKINAAAIKKLSQNASLPDPVLVSSHAICNSPPALGNIFFSMLYAFTFVAFSSLKSMFI